MYLLIYVHDDVADEWMTVTTHYVNDRATLTPDVTPLQILSVILSVLYLYGVLSQTIYYSVVLAAMAAPQINISSGSVLSQPPPFHTAKSFSSKQKL